MRENMEKHFNERKNTNKVREKTVSNSDTRKKTNQIVKYKAIQKAKQNEDHKVINKVKTVEKRNDGDAGRCPYAKKCGGCALTGMPYPEQLKKKQHMMEELLGSFAKVEPIIGMKEPEHYRNKVHHVFDRDGKGNIIAGSYEAGSHKVVDIDECMIEDVKSQQIIKTIKELAKSFKISIYDEDSGFGLLRHVMVRRGFKSGEIMVVLVLSSPILPGKNNFVKALKKAHPEITTIVINVNDADTSMVLGEKETVIYGPGFIKDELCGCRFRISPKSFYQVNPVQTERLYKKAIEFAQLTGSETVIDAYCGIGTIGLSAASHAGEVIGIELNPDAVKNARLNARENGIKNARFFVGDAGDFMNDNADELHPDVIFMDPPRSGSTEKFMSAAVKMKPERIVYISCGPDTLKRDLKYFKKHGYKAERIQPFDMFPFTAEHVENVVLLTMS